MRARHWETQPRQPKGTPVGGEWNATAGGGAATSLGSFDHDPEQIALTVPGALTVYELPSPRHRKPRPVSYEHQGQVSVREVSADQAPVVFDMGERAIGFDRTPARRFEVREFDGQRYALARANYGRSCDDATDDGWWREEPLDVEGFQRLLTPDRWNGFGRSENLTREEFTAKVDADLQARADEHIIIDGQVWQRCGEPRYVVHFWTGGFGGDHGAASVELRVELDDRTDADVERVFRADQYDDALARAKKEHERLAVQWTHTRFDACTKIACDPNSVRLVVPPKPTEQVKRAREEFADLLGSHETRSMLEDLDRLRYNPGGCATTNEQVRTWLASVTAAAERLERLTPDLVGEESRRRPYEPEA